MRSYNGGSKKYINFESVKQIGVFTFLIYYTLGTLIFPMGDLSYMRDVPEMYQLCSLEDPDIDFADFIFEHLANIKGDDEGENEKTHQPVFHHVPVQVAAMLCVKIKLSPACFNYFEEGLEYPTIRAEMTLCRKPGRVFRPPISLS